MLLVVVMEVLKKVVVGGMSGVIWLWWWKWYDLVVKACGCDSTKLAVQGNFVAAK